jgi:hypothetical protein
MAYESVIDRFAAFVRNLYPADKAGPEVPYPFQLDPYRNTIEHHLLPLIMIARADRHLLKDERNAIVDHCRALLRQQDKLLSASEITAMQDYITHFAPNHAQLDTALQRFRTGAPGDFGSLLAGAEHVMTADDVVTDEEKSELEEIKTQFEALRTKS